MRRRELLIGATALAALGPASLARAASDQGGILLGLRRREYNAMFAYHRVLHVDPLVALLHQHAEDHAQAVATELAALGLGAPPPPKVDDDLDIAAHRIATAADGDALRAGLLLEEDLVSVYKTALPAFPEPKIAMTVATILASHSQHVVILRDAVGDGDPLETG